MIPMLPLPDDEIHLWVTYPEKIKQFELLTKYKQLMSEDECQRQQRYRFEKDRHSALITRAFVRSLLSHYDKLPPESWTFTKGEKDKPEIANLGWPLRFNLSHTEGMIICAVTRNNDIGADVEYIYRDSEVLDIADRYFSPSEVSALNQLDTLKAKRSRFFDYWTLKESYIKARGLGLAIPLEQFSFQIATRPQNALCFDKITLEFDSRLNDDGNNWQSWLLYPCHEYRIAISINDGTTPYQLKLFETVPLLQKKNLSLPFKQPD